MRFIVAKKQFWSYLLSKYVDKKFPRKEVGFG